MFGRLGLWSVGKALALQAAAQHGVPPKPGITCSRPLSAALRGHAAQLPKLSIRFDGWRSGRWAAADAGIVARRACDMQEAMPMFNIIFPLLLVVIFGVMLVMISTLNKTRRIILLILYSVLSIAYLALYVTYVRAPEYDSALNYGVLFIGIIYAAQLVARVILKRRAGPLVLRLRQLTPTTIIGVIAVPVFLLMTLFILRPSTRSEATGMPIFDDDYIKSRLGLLLFLVPASLYYWQMARQRTEFHERGILQDGALWAWTDFESYSWNASTASDIELMLKPKATVWRSQPTKYAVPAQNKQVIDDLLKSAY
jgi:hypothetical protein